jgi:hypothetical protein
LEPVTNKAERARLLSDVKSTSTTTENLMLHQLKRDSDYGVRLRLCTNLKRESDCNNEDEGISAPMNKKL